MPMELKLDEQGHVVVQDGKPVYIEGDREIPFDANMITERVTRLNGESMSHRKKAEELEAKLSTYEGIEDPEAARKAMQTIKNIDQGQLIAAGKVEEIKKAAKLAAEEQAADITKQYQTKLQTAEQERDALRTQLHDHMIGGAFARSPLITDPKHPKALVLPADVAQSYFGKHFSIEGGRIVAKDYMGQKIYSRINTNMGDPADFDEALEILVDSYPRKDQILRGSQNRGDGASGGRGGNGTGVRDKQIARGEFDKLSMAEKQKILKEGVRVIDR